jgi:hypothetical protein
MKTNTHPIGLRTIWLLVLALAFAAARIDSVQAAFILSIDVGNITLNPNQAGQQRDVYIQNTGDTDFQAQGLTLRLQLDDGLGGGNAPTISNVNAVNGTPWEGQLGSVINQTTQTEFWDVRVLSDAFGGKSATLGAQSQTKLATVTFDTTSLSSGTWAFKLAGFDITPNPGDSKYNALGSGTEIFPTVNNGLISVVPEPASYALATGIILIGAAAFKQCRYRS